MQHEISCSLLFLSTAHDIWKAAKQTYSRVNNDAEIYELQKKVDETKQKGMTVFAYYFDFQALWHQLDSYQDFQVDCVADSTKFKKLVDKERV